MEHEAAGDIPAADLFIEPQSCPQTMDLHDAADLRRKLHTLSHLDFTEEEAHWHWRRIHQHQDNLSRSLGRDIGFAVAMIDYFVNITKKIANPKVLELSDFNRTVRESLKDPLTNLYNRKYMHIALRNERKRAKRYGTQFSLLFIDVDFFKKINDEFGHLVGDQVLRETAQILLSNSRGEDHVFRYAGEEFVILMPQTSKEDAIHLAERVRKRMEQHVFEGLGRERRVTLSGGIASFPTDGQTAELLLHEADQCLYEAKASGRNRIVHYRGKSPLHKAVAAKSAPEQTFFPIEELLSAN